MEKRFYLGIGILLVFLLLGLTVSWAMRQVTQPVAQMLEQAAQRNHPMANQVLGQLFLSRSPDAPFDPRRALDHLLTARNLGAHVDDALIREAQDLLRR